MATFLSPEWVLKVRVGDNQQTFTELPGPQGIPVFFQCAQTGLASFSGFIDVPAPFDYTAGVSHMTHKFQAINGVKR